MEHQDLHSALRFLRAAQDTFNLLSRHAKMGKVTAFENKFLAGTRMFPIKGFPKHLVFYRPSHRSIEVLRIIHGTRDLERTIGATHLMTSSPKPHRRRWIFLLFGMFLIFAALAGLGAMNLGSWLVISDPLEPARAIVVLNGEVPARAMEAANLYHQKLAPEVWVTPDRPSPAMEKLGVHYLGDDEYNVELLKNFGVPLPAIHRLSEAARNTEGEEIVILRELRRVGGDRIILVTSRFHTRRARAIWHALTGSSPQVIVRGAPKEVYDARHWWRNSDDISKVVHEFFGLLNAWAKFPARSIRRESPL